MSNLTDDELIDLAHELENRGYAVIIFTSEEIKLPV